MPTMSDVQSVAANTTTANVLAGKQFEFAPGASIVRFYACASAVGLNLTINVGGQALVADEEIRAPIAFRHAIKICWPSLARCPAKESSCKRGTPLPARSPAIYS